MYDYFHRTLTIDQICAKYEISASTLYTWKALFFQQKKIWLGLLEDANTSPIQFIDSFTSGSFLQGLKDFLNIAGQSFLQGSSYFRKAIIDDHSRLIVGARFFYHDNAYNFQLVLKEAIARYGLCNRLYTDNGSPYSNTQLTLILGSLGIIEIHAPVRDGAAKAKVERSFRTIKDTWLNGFDSSSVTSLEELNLLLAEYVRMRNNTVNRDIEETPMVRYSRHVDRIRVPKSREWLDECFMNRIMRKVSNDSTVSIESISYDVPMQFIRMKVEIRFLPDDMKNAYILYEGRRYPIRPTNKVENSRVKRENLLVIDYSISRGVTDV